MRNALEKKLRGSDAQEMEMILDQLNPEGMLDPEAMGRITGRLEKRLAEERKNGQSVREDPGSGRRKNRHLVRNLLAAAAACLAVFLVLGMTVPGVSRALYSLAHPDHRTESYLLTPPDEREQIPDIEEAIRSTHAQDISYSVEMLGEYSILTRYDEDYNRMATETPTQREKYGFSPYRAEDYAYLKSLVPEIREVFYDGSRLTMNTYFACGYAADFMVGWGFDLPHTHNLDMTTFELIADVDGTDVSDLLGGYGTGTMMSIWNKTPESDLSGIEGFWCTTDCDDLAAPLPDGTCTVTLLYYIYDGDVDDMGAIGNVARVIHTFSFDTTPGNHYQTAGITVPLHGSAALTVASLESGQMALRTVSLEGVSLHADISYLPSGILVTVEPGKVPVDWTKPMVDALFGSGHLGSTLEFEIHVDGDSLKMPQRMSSGLQQIRFELPVLPSDYAGIGEIVLVPKVHTPTAFTPAFCADPEKEGTAGKVVLVKDGEPMDFPESFQIDDGDYEDTVLTGCEIHISLPENPAEGGEEALLSVPGAAETAAPEAGSVPGPEGTDGEADPEIGRTVREPLHLEQSYHDPGYNPYTVTRIDGNRISNLSFPIDFDFATDLEFGEKAIRCSLTFDGFGAGCTEEAREAFLQISSGTMRDPGNSPGLLVSYNLGTKNEPETYPEVENRGGKLVFLIPVTPERYSTIDPGINIGMIRADRYDGKPVRDGWSLDPFDPELVTYGWHGWIGFTLGMHQGEPLDPVSEAGVQG